VFVSSISQKLDMLVALANCVGMISTPRLTTGEPIVRPWSISLEKIREIFVGGTTGKTRFSSFISSFPLRKRKKSSEVLLSKTDRYLLIIVAGEPP